MTLVEMVREYQELLEAKNGLAEAAKNNNKAIEKKKQEIAQQMVDDDCPEIGYGDYIFSLADKTIYSKKSEAALQEAGLDFFEVLREQGLGDLIQETVSSRTLNSAIRNLVEEQGELPEDLDAVISRYDTTDIDRKKKPNKALKNAKKGEK